MFSTVNERNSIVVLIWITLVMFFTLIFTMVSQLILKSQCIIPALQDSLLCLSAATAGVTAEQGEPDKDSHLAALQTTSKSSTSATLASCHFLEELSMCL